MAENGRPAYDDDWYRARLDEMRPILCRGNSIRYAAEKVGIGMHKNVLYRKYAEPGWFRDKVDEYRATPGESVNDILIGLVEQIGDKARLKQPIDKNDLDVLKLVAEKHRSAQPFFVSRTETAEANPDEVGKILDKIESDYSKVGTEAKKEQEAKKEHVGPTTEKQVVATNAPVQDQGQTGADSNLQSK